MSSREQYFHKSYGELILLHTGSELNKNLYHMVLRANFLEREKGYRNTNVQHQRRVSVPQCVETTHAAKSGMEASN